MNIDPHSDNGLVDQRSDMRSYYRDDWTAGSSDAGWAGGTFAESAWSIAEGIGKGQWEPVAFGGAGTLLDAAAAGFDPIGFVAGQIAGWMLEHCTTLRAALHGFTGNAEMVKAYANTWTTISGELKKTANSYRESTWKGTANWHGPAVQGYWSKQHGIASLLDTLAGTAATLSVAAQAAAEYVNGLRSAVRDLLAHLAGSLVSYTIELAFTAGAAAPVVAAQATSRIAAVAMRIVEIIHAAGKRISDLGLVLAPLKSLVEGAWRAAQVPSR
jgi:hypothetical protein